MKIQKDLDMNFLNKKDPAIGIDIGHRGLKAVELKKTDKGIILENFFYQDLTQGNENYPQFPNMEYSLEAAVEVNGFKNKKVCFSLGNSEMDSTEFVFPMLPKKELTVAIANELEQTLNIPLENIFFDYIIFENLGSDEEIHVKVFYAMKDILLSKIATVETACLKPQVVDIDILALASMLQYNGYTPSEEHYYVLIDIGESQSSVALLKGSQVLYSHTTPFSFGIIIQTIMDHLEISYVEASKIIHDYSLTTQEGLEESLREIVEQTFEHFFDSLQESVDYYLEKTKKKIDTIFLTGGGSQKADIRDIIENHYQLKVEVVNPFRNIELFQKSSDMLSEEKNETIIHIAPLMATAVGLALRGVA